MSDESVFARINREADEARRARYAELEADGNVWDELDVWLDCGRADDLRPVENAIFAYWSGVAQLKRQSLKKRHDSKSLLESIKPIWMQLKRLVPPLDEDKNRVVDKNTGDVYRIAPPAPNNHQLPLRTVMDKRGETIEWMNLGNDMLGKKNVRAVVVKVKK